MKDQIFYPLGLSSFESVYSDWLIGNGVCGEAPVYSLKVNYYVLHTPEQVLG